MDNDTRSKIMKSVKSVSKLEDLVASALWNKGYRFRRNTKKLFGTPDISIKKYKVVIFIDSCFWHFCPEHGRIPKVNNDYWQAKYIKNTTRDKKVNDFYQERGWNIIRIWEHELKEDFDLTISKLAKFIDRAMKEEKIEG
ncbi:T/G mismatch-specific endonuclease [Bhargavaea beijingensis]|uniref:Very short patch repair endonuclease n=1 Tax=Bhargavaea beijingensis TaxID=426756 RepID=A0A1G6XKA8_9BACL|nr:very short patch repair endonuclease [Bhargavaea beijingensis]SDD78664.1 T/G mismatch-specific endonuclease [Bhargavaea beijingensis]